MDNNSICLEDVPIAADFSVLSELFGRSYRRRREAWTEGVDIVEQRTVASSNGYLLRLVVDTKEAYYECKIKCIGNPNEQECQYYYERPKRNRDDKVVKDKLK